MSHAPMGGVPEAFETCLIGDSHPDKPKFSLCPPHLVEEEVVRTLRNAPGVYVESLSAHRIDEGVCLHGVVEIDDPSTSIEAILRRSLSIDHVINRMVVKHGHYPSCPSTDFDECYQLG